MTTEFALAFLKGDGYAITSSTWSIESSPPTPPDAQADMPPDTLKIIIGVLYYNSTSNSVTAYQIITDNITATPSEWIRTTREDAGPYDLAYVKGNIWELNAKHGWRARGWLDSAYPAIGRGALVPVDWCGEGCNLLSKRALAVASFEGYEGHGTQDLFLCWRKYHPAEIRIACIPHTLCDHVKHDGTKVVHHQALHEQLGESRGHLRVLSKEWVEV